MNNANDEFIYYNLFFLITKVLYSPNGKSSIDELRNVWSVLNGISVGVNYSIS